MATTKAKPHSTQKKGTTGKKGVDGLGKAKLAEAKRAHAESQLAKPFGVITGLVASAAIGYGIDHIPFLKPDEGATGFQVKKIVKPLLLTATGVVVAIVTHKNEKKSNVVNFVNGVGYGVAAGGVVSGISVATGKPLVTGLGETDGTGSTKKHLEVEYYKAQAKDAQRLLEKNKWNNNLNEDRQPERNEEMKGVDGMGASETDYSGELPL